MNKEQLLERLQLIAKLDGDRQVAHLEADTALLEYINDPEIREAFDYIKKWYA